MSDLDTSVPRAGAPTTSRRRTLLRWLVSFTGFPLGGLVAIALTGRVDGPVPAIAGGLVTGAVIGAVQAWALGAGRVRPVAWVVATAIGMMAGLALGSALVDYRTGLGSLVIQGAVTGVLVGAAQAAVLLPRIGYDALYWPGYLAGIWAAGWAVTTLGGIQVDEQFTVFGSFGALTATLLTAGLPLVIDRHTVRDTVGDTVRDTARAAG